MRLMSRASRSAAALIVTTPPPSLTLHVALAHYFLHLEEQKSDCLLHTKLHMAEVVLAQDPASTMRLRTAEYEAHQIRQVLQEGDRQFMRVAAWKADPDLCTSHVSIEIAYRRTVDSIGQDMPQITAEQLLGSQQWQGVSLVSQKPFFMSSGLRVQLHELVLDVQVGASARSLHQIRQELHPRLIFGQP